MDQIKIGKFIAACRKEQSLTQAQLAERLGITDRAVSKWETGKSMPDSSLMLELCGILEINVNELLSGERLVMEDYNKKAEENLLAMKKQKEESDKRLLNMEVILGFIAGASFMILIFTASFIMMPAWVRILLILLGFVLFIVGVAFCLKIEQTAGYYECQHCRHKYVPTYGSVFWAPHMNRTRYMKCPVCGQKSWQKKVISKDE